jgi:hypothetical protein
MRSDKPPSFALRPPVRSWAWLATVVLLIVHWAVPVLTLPELNLGSKGPLEYSTDERDGHPAVAARIASSSVVLRSGFEAKKQEICDFRSKDLAVIAAIAQDTIEPFQIVRFAAVPESAPLGPRHSFFARGPPLHAV